MEKSPATRMSNNLDRFDRKTEVEILDPVKKNSPFISFKYSYREISSVGGKTYLRAKEKKFENGKFTSEEFEGVAPGNIHSNMAAEMQKMFFGLMGAVLKAIRGY